MTPGQRVFKKYDGGGGVSQYCINCLGYCYLYSLLSDFFYESKTLGCCVTKVESGLLRYHFSSKLHLGKVNCLMDNTKTLKLHARIFTLTGGGWSAQMYDQYEGGGEGL